MWKTEGLPPVATQPELCRVVNCRSAVIAAGEEAILDGRLTNGWPEGKDGLIEGLREVEGERGFLVGRGLVGPQDGWVPVRILNSGATPIIIYKDMGIATLEGVQVGAAGGDAGGESAVTNGEAFCRMVTAAEDEADKVDGEVVLASLCEGVEEAKRTELRQLLRTYLGDFQLNPGDKGRTDRVQHHINTGDHAPIKQPPRRLAPHRRKVVGDEVEKNAGGRPD